MEYRLLFPQGTLNCKKDNIDFIFAVSYLLSVVRAAKIGAQSDLHDSEVFYIEKIEEDTPDTGGKALNDIDYNEVFHGEQKKGFASVYSEIRQLWMDLHEDNKQYNFGEEVNHTKEQFIERLNKIENELKRFL